MPAWIMVTTVVAGKSRQTYFPPENSYCKSFQPKNNLQTPLQTPIKPICQSWKPKKGL